MQPSRKLVVVAMAAGKGTRMKDPSRAKVMALLNGKPVIHYVLHLADELNAERTIAVLGHQKQSVQAYMKEHFPESECVTQEPQLGTGHSVMQAEAALTAFSGDVLVLSGDVPLLQRQTVSEMIEHHRKTGAVSTILTARLDDPSGYGRIIRNEDRSVKKIVEHRDASPEELRVREINSGIYLFQKEKLFESLKRVRPHNVKNEYYLTDVFEYFWKHHWVVSALTVPHANEIKGINTMEQLEEARGILRAREP